MIFFAAFFAVVLWFVGLGVGMLVVLRMGQPVLVLTPWVVPWAIVCIAIIVGISALHHRRG